MPPLPRWIARFLLVGCALLGSARAQAPAQQLSPDRVTFFTEPNFRGEALTIEAGASVENLDRLQRPSQKPWTFAISSARVEGAGRATVFSGPNYSGDRLEIVRSVPDLYGQPRGRDGETWDRAIASVTVTGPQRVVAPVSAPPPQTVMVVPGPAAPPPQTVVVVPSPAAPPPVIVQEIRPRLDRRTAEMIVQHAYREVLNRPADPEGLRRYRDRLIYEDWSERQIVEQLQRSGEARGINADEAIARAYRETLGRDPDPNGLAHYRAKWREGWTQGQIRDDLRRSAEGRDSYIRNAIMRAYRDVLGRDPDPGGYATYEKAMRERGYTERDIRAALMSGDEYRQKHPRGR